MVLKSIGPAPDVNHIFKQLMNNPCLPYEYTRYGRQGRSVVP